MKRRHFLAIYKLPALAAINACSEWRSADDVRTGFLNTRPYLHSRRQYREFNDACFDAVEEKMGGGSANENDALEAIEFDDFEGPAYCYDCGNRGWIVDCIDDLCHGQSECIHGDPPRPCRYCNADAMKEDSHL